MDKPQGYWRIEQMMDQLGHGIGGALAYIGTSRVVYKARADDSLPKRSQELKRGLVDYEIGLLLSVNGRLGWRILITIEPDDTYTVRMLHCLDTEVKHLDKAEGVYCDQLQEVVERMYDDAVKEHLGGFIPIG